MRLSVAFALAGVGLVLAYLVARQVSPMTFAAIENKVSSAFSDLLVKFEGYSAEPYQDAAGLWTIGIGHLIVPGDGFWSPDNPNGIAYINEAAARSLADQDAATARAAVERSVFVPLTENQKSALVSLAYNIGAQAFRTSTLVRLLNAGNYDAAAEQFGVWNKVRDPVSGVLMVSSGLDSRRRNEKDLFTA